MGKLGRERVFFVTPRELEHSQNILIPAQSREENATSEYVEIKGEKYEKKKIDNFKMPSDLYGITPLKFNLRDDGNWEAALSGISHQISTRVNILKKKENPQEKIEQLLLQIQNLSEETGKVIDSYEQLERLFWFTDEVKEIPNIHDEKDYYNRILMALDIGIGNGQFDKKGITLYKLEEQEQDQGQKRKVMVQRGQFKNVGEIGKVFPYDYDPSKNGEINVVEALKINKITTFKKKFGNEYLISIPILEKFVVTLHLQHTIRLKDAEAELDDLINNNVNPVIEKLENFLSKAPEKALI